MSSSLTPRATRFSRFTSNPVAAVRSPRAIIVSRSAASTFCQVTDFGSMPTCFAKIGKDLRAASKTGAPMLLPARSCGLAIPDFLSACTMNGVSP